jgi:hypothetical protein
MVERTTSDAEINAVARSMDKLKNNLGRYADSLRIVLDIRKELDSNPRMIEEIKKDPGTKLNELYLKHGVPEDISKMMVAEDTEEGDIVSFCCCTGCCVTFKD